MQILIKKQRLVTYLGGSGFLAAVILVAILIAHSSIALTKVDANVIRIDAEYAADYSNDNVLVGASHNIFVGKVLQRSGTKERGIGPESQFQVEVIENIKGNLQGDVAVDQQGGYKDGVLYVVGDDTVGPQKGSTSYLLQPGATYVFATRYNPSENWHTLNSYPTASKLLSTDANISDTDAKALADNDQRVQQLKAAYPNEILLQADITHNNTLNSYASVQAVPANPPAPQPEPPPNPPADTPVSPPADASTTDSSATPDSATSTSAMEASSSDFKNQ